MKRIVSPCSLSRYGGDLGLVALDIPDPSLNLLFLFTLPRPSALSLFFSLPVLQQGSLDIILQRSASVFVNVQEHRPLTDAVKARLTEAAGGYATDGYRVLALAQGSDLHNLSVLGEAWITLSTLFGRHSTTFIDAFAIFLFLSCVTGLVAMADHPRQGVA